MSLKAGQSFDRYRIEAVLGEGGMGAVYRAFDTRLQRIVALKVLRPSTDGSTGGTARILREARAAAALSHPNAVVIHDVGEASGTAFIAMEYIEGKSLREYVPEPGAKVDFARQLGFLRDVAEVLQRAHERGLVHRDIKPENVMVKSDGTVKVLDFGIARRVRTEVDPSAPTVESSENSTNTGEGVVAGTPAYMAPEQIRNESVDARTDQFSWAVMAFELLSGRSPWKPRAQVAIIASIVMDDPLPLEGVEPRVARVIGKALSKSPSQRHASMRALLDALDDNAPPPPERRARKWIAAGAVVMAIAAMFAIVHKHKPIVTPPPPTSASASSDPGCNATAIRLHREGLNALRQIGWDAAQHAFEGAIAADPGCAAPHLRLALMGPGLSMPSSRVRATYQKAVELRDHLTPVERDLLDAAEPCIARDPPDRVECAKRAAPLAEKWPKDAELLVWVADLAYRASAEHETILRRALAIDPVYADAWQGIAILRMRVNDTAGALEALDKCIEVAPASGDCRFERVRIDFRRNECKPAEKHARDWAARAPGQAFPMRFFAYSLAAQGEPREVVEEALRPRWKVLEDEFRDFVTTLEKAQVAAFYGDFSAARALSLELAKQAEGNDYARHAEASMFAAQLAEEEGRTADVLAVAKAFRLGTRVWPYPTVFTPYNWTATPEAAPALLRLEAAAGGMSASDLAKSLAAWKEEASARVNKMQLFAYGPASIAATQIEAELEIASAPLPLMPLRLDQDGALFRTTIARLLARAGRSDDALVYFKAAAADCGPLADAFAAVRAHARLAEHLESRGDAKAACDEWAYVLAHWGKAEKSVTSDLARKRRKALACK